MIKNQKLISTVALLIIPKTELEKKNTFSFVNGIILYNCHTQARCLMSCNDTHSVVINRLLNSVYSYFMLRRVLQPAEGLSVAPGYKLNQFPLISHACHDQAINYR